MPQSNQRSQDEENDAIDDKGDRWGPENPWPDGAFPPPLEVLRDDLAPAWLRDARMLDAGTLTNFLSSRVVYYPGAGTDGQAIQLFGSAHAACCFVHADYNIGTDQIERQFLWCVLDRMVGFTAEHGPKRIAFMHFTAEAVWTYWNLWARFKRGGPYAMVLQDHKFGGNWTTFGDPEGPLHQMAVQSGLPNWLLVGDNTNYWPGYELVSDPTAPTDSNPRRRRLYHSPR